MVEGIQETDKLTNMTTTVKPMPLSSWFPFDEQEHYVISYCWQFVDGCIAASFVTFTDCLIFSLIIFPLGQITLLNYELVNFQTYINTTGMSADAASKILIRNFALQHQEIIW